MAGDLVWGSSGRGGGKRQRVCETEVAEGNPQFEPIGTNIILCSPDLKQPQCCVFMGVCP